MPKRELAKLAICILLPVLAFVIGYENLGRVWQHIINGLALVPYAQSGLGPFLLTVVAIFVAIFVAVYAVYIAVCVYFLPTVIARARRHKNFTAVLVLNLFLGWTLLGWVGALVWALVEQERGVPVQH